MMTTIFDNTKQEILNSILPDGDNYTVMLATTDDECKEFEGKGYYFIGRGLYRGNDTFRFSAYLRLRDGYRP